MEIHFKVKYKVNFKRNSRCQWKWISPWPSAATTIMLRALASNRADHVLACNMAEGRQVANKQHQKRAAKGKRPARESAGAKDEITVQRMRMNGLEFGTSYYKKAHVRQLSQLREGPRSPAKMSQTISLSIWAAKYFWQASTMLSKAISSTSNGANSLGPILVYFCCFPITSQLIFCRVISSFASADSRAGRFPLAALFWRCLFANCLPSAMLQDNTWSALLLASARSMMVVAALGHGEIHFHFHFEFRLKLTLYFTLKCISILV